MSKEITKTDKIKLRALASPQFIPALNELINQELPKKTAYWLCKVAKKINSELTDYQKALEKIQRKYAEIDNNGEIVLVDGNIIKFKDGETYAFNKEFQELLDVEVEVLKISHEAILEGGSTIKASVMMAIDELMY